MGSGTETTVSTVMFYTKCRGVQYQPGLEASMKDKYYVTKQGRNFLIYKSQQRNFYCAKTLDVNMYKEKTNVVFQNVVITTAIYKHLNGNLRGKENKCNGFLYWCTYWMV